MSERTKKQSSIKQASLIGVAAALQPLFSFSAHDQPEAVLVDGPDPKRVIKALKQLLSVVVPGRAVFQCSSQQRGGAVEDAANVFAEAVAQNLSTAWSILEEQLLQALPYRWRAASALAASKAPGDPEQLTETTLVEFFKQIATVRQMLVQDLQAAYDGDPAALSYAEVRIAYPGILAIATHRIAHQLYQLDVPIIPRVMSEWAHSKTGVDIHPGAQIGPRFFVDHATGVVIGETARIGSNVKFYQGVTLGSRSFALDESGNPVKRIQRHPTVEDNVVIYSNATILGGDTVIGAGSTIGGNVFLMESVPPGSVVVQDGTAPKVIQKLKH